MGLRAAAMRGGTYLVGRQAASLVIHLSGVLLLTRLIGPTSYGMYATAFGIYTFLYTVGQCGVNVYLIRREEPLTADAHRLAFTLLLVIGTTLGAAATLTTPLIERWTRIDGLGPIARVLFWALPVQLLTLVPSAVLERALDYRRVAQCEVIGQAACYLVALPLAWRGLGAWAPVAGYWTQQLVVLTLLVTAGRYRPALYWNRALAREILTYGWTFSSVTWIWQLRELVNSLIVSRFAGADAVAYVALTARFVDALSFVKAAAWRLSIAVLPKLRLDTARLLSAVSEGMRLQVLVLGPIFVAFGLFAPIVTRSLFGERWVVVSQLFPFVALGVLTGAVFNLYTSTLCLVNRMGHVAIFHVVHLILFFGGALLLVPRIGVLGYGWSELIALPGYAVIYAYMSRDVGTPRLGITAVWWLGSAIALFWPRLGWWAALGPIIALAWPGTVAEFRRYAASLVALRHARDAAH